MFNLDLKSGGVFIFLLDFWIRSWIRIRNPGENYRNQVNICARSSIVQIVCITLQNSHEKKGLKNKQKNLKKLKTLRKTGKLSVSVLTLYFFCVFFVKITIFVPSYGREIVHLLCKIFWKSHYDRDKRKTRL